MICLYIKHITKFAPARYCSRKIPLWPSAAESHAPDGQPFSCGVVELASSWHECSLQPAQHTVLGHTAPSELTNKIPYAYFDHQYCILTLYYIY